jgi:hypothetical protein
MFCSVCGEQWVARACPNGHAAAPPAFWQGLSINVSLRPESLHTIQLPVPPLWRLSDGNLVLEIVAWSGRHQRWLHLVSEHFPQGLPVGHLQLSYDDFGWIQQVKRRGPQVVAACIRELEVGQRNDGTIRRA